jgi:hypothetical protein
VGLGVETLRDWCKAIGKAALFSSFGAGLGVGLGIIIFIIVDYLRNDGFSFFDCSSADLCAYSFFNVFLVLLMASVGAGGIAVLGSILGFIYALPMTLLAGTIMVTFGHGNPMFWKKRWLFMLVGSALGMTWWLILSHFQLLPIFSALASEGDGTPDLFQPFKSGAIALPALAGLVSAEMFRQWISAELMALRSY